MDVVLALQPPRAEALHECSPEEANQVPVQTIFEHLDATVRNRCNAGRGVYTSTRLGNTLKAWGTTTRYLTDGQSNAIQVVHSGGWFVHQCTMLLSADSTYHAGSIAATRCDHKTNLADDK